MTGRSMTRRGGGGGFTLIEVLLVLAIIGFVTTLMWSSFSQAARSKKRIEAAQERTHTVRLALLRMARELEMAYWSENHTASVAATDQRTPFIGARRADIDELTFAAFAHQRLRAEVPEGDTSRIVYYGQRDPSDRYVMNLMRHETRRVQNGNPRDLPGETYVLCPDVVRLKFSYWDYRKKEWVEEWNTTVLGMDRLPSHVRISMTVRDERRRERTFSTDARIHMTEKVGRR